MGLRVPATSRATEDLRRLDWKQHTRCVVLAFRNARRNMRAVYTF